MLENQSFLDLELCAQAVEAQSNITETSVVDLTVTKVASQQCVLVNGQLCYTVTISNNSDIPFTDVVFRDPLGQYMQYVPGTFTINGSAATPTVDQDNVLSYSPISVPVADVVSGPGTVVINFCVTVTGIPPTA